MEIKGAPGNGELPPEAREAIQNGWGKDNKDFFKSEALKSSTSPAQPAGGTDALQSSQNPQELGASAPIRTPPPPNEPAAQSIAQPATESIVDTRATDKTTLDDQPKYNGWGQKEYYQDLENLCFQLEIAKVSQATNLQSLLSLAPPEYSHASEDERQGFREGVIRIFAEEFLAAGVQPRDEILAKFQNIVTAEDYQAVIKRINELAKDKRSEGMLSLVTPDVWDAWQPNSQNPNAQTPAQPVVEAAAKPEATKTWAEQIAELKAQEEKQPPQEPKESILLKKVPPPESIIPPTTPPEIPEPGTPADQKPDGRFKRLAKATGGFLHKQATSAKEGARFVRHDPIKAAGIGLGMGARIGVKGGWEYLKNVGHPLGTLRHPSKILTKKELAWYTGAAAGGVEAIILYNSLPPGVARLVKMGFSTVLLHAPALAIYLGRELSYRRNIYKNAPDESTAKQRIEEIDEKYDKATLFLHSFTKGFAAGTTYGAFFTVSGLSEHGLEIVAKSIAKATGVNTDQLPQRGFDWVRNKMSSPPSPDQLLNQKLNNKAFVDAARQIVSQDQEIGKLVNNLTRQSVDDIIKADGLSKNNIPTEAYDKAFKTFSDKVEKMGTDAFKEAAKEKLAAGLSNDDAIQAGKSAYEASVQHQLDLPKNSTEYQNWLKSNREILNNVLNEGKVPQAATATATETPTAKPSVTATATQSPLPSTTAEPTPQKPAPTPTPGSFNSNPDYLTPRPNPTTIHSADDIIKQKATDYIQAHQELHLTQLDVEDELKQEAAAAVGKHIDKSTELANQAIIAEHMNPKQISAEAFEKVRKAVQTQMEIQVNTEVNNIPAGSDLNEIKNSINNHYDATMAKVMDPANAEMQKPFLDAGKEALQEQLKIEEKLTNQITEALHVQPETAETEVPQAFHKAFENQPEDILNPNKFAAGINVQSGDTVSGLIDKYSDYKITWTSQDAPVFAAHIAANHDLLDQAWAANSWPEDFHFPAQSELYQLVEDAQRGDPVALQRLHRLWEALHYIKSTDLTHKQFIVLQSGGVDKIMSLLKQFSSEKAVNPVLAGIK